MKVPLVDLYKQYVSIKEEIDTAIANVIRDCAFVGGGYRDSFEKNFAAYLGARNCIGVGNGTDALYVALTSLQIGEGDEVITAANTFIATAEAITQTGARVVFVDCDSTSYNIDVAKIEEAVTEKTRAIVPVHLYGQPVDMDNILEIARKHKLFVVEDAAQAHGARYKGRFVGTIGDCGCFSFFPGKNLGAYGDGGAIVTNRDDLSEKMRMFANHGRKEKYGHEFEGINSRLDGLQAAILDVKLRHLDEWTKRRGEVAAMYDEAMKGVVITPAVDPSVVHAYHLYVIRTERRDECRQLLAEGEISTGIHYPIPLPFLQAYEYLGHAPEDFPVSYALKDEILSLPMHGSLTDEGVEHVVGTLKNGLRLLD